MRTSTISTKGQITLPATLRKKLGLKAHDRVTFESEGEAIVIRKAIDIFELQGCLGKALPREQERRAAMKAASLRALGKST